MDRNIACQILGVEKFASLSEVRDAYLKRRAILYGRSLTTEDLVSNHGDSLENLYQAYEYLYGNLAPAASPAMLPGTPSSLARIGQSNDESTPALIESPGLEPARVSASEALQLDAPSNNLSAMKIFLEQAFPSVSIAAMPAPADQPEIVSPQLPTEEDDAATGSGIEHAVPAAPPGRPDCAVIFQSPPDPSFEYTATPQAQRGPSIFRSPLLVVPFAVVIATCILMLPLTRTQPASDLSKSLPSSATRVPGPQPQAALQPFFAPQTISLDPPTPRNSAAAQKQTTSPGQKEDTVPPAQIPSPTP